MAPELGPYMLQDSNNFLFKWRWAFTSKNGPLSATTRHVLWTLSGHMDSNGQNAFPSIQKLAQEAALDSRTVGKHLREAVRDGWITRKKWRTEGKDWSQYKYFPLIPDRLNGAECGSGANIIGAERGADGAEPNDSLVRNDVPTNSTVNSTYNSTGNTILNRGPHYEMFCKVAEKMIKKEKHHFEASLQTNTNRVSE